MKLNNEKVYRYYYLEKENEVNRPLIIYSASNLTNDTYEPYQWALDNCGQNGGTSGYDMNPISVTSSESLTYIAISVI